METLISKLDDPPADPFARKKQLQREDVLSFIRKLSQSIGSQKRLARAMGIGEPYLSEILKGRREIPERVLDLLEMKRTEVYERNGR